MSAKPVGSGISQRALLASILLAGKNWPAFKPGSVSIYGKKRRNALINAALDVADTIIIRDISRKIKEKA